MACGEDGKVGWQGNAEGRGRAPVGQTHGRIQSDGESSCSKSNELSRRDMQLSSPQMGR